MPVKAAAVPKVEVPERAPSEHVQVDLKLIESAIDAIPPETISEMDYDTYRNHIFAIHSATGGSAAGIELANKFSRKSTKHKDGYFEDRIWQYAKPDRDNAITIETLFGTARREGNFHDHDLALLEFYDDPAPKPTKKLFRHISEIIAENRKINWLIRNILEAGVLALVYGDRETFKSFLVLLWAGLIALEDHGVVMMNAEGDGLGRRWRALLKQYAPHKAIEDLKVFALERPVLLGDTAVFNEVLKDIRALPWQPKLIVIDTLSKYSAGIDENSNTDMAKFIGQLAQLRDEFKATVLVVTHTGHTEKGRPRGASVLMANMDTEFGVTRKDGEMSITVTRERFKDSPALPPLVYDASVIDLGGVDDEGNAITSLVLTESQVTAGAPKPKLKRFSSKHKDTIVKVLADPPFPKKDGGMDMKELLRVATDRTPHDPDKKDRRREMLTKAVQGLASDNFVQVIDNRVYLENRAWENRS